MQIKTFLDLCSGIGGGRLGLELAGLKSIGYSDTSKLAVRTYTLMHNTKDEPYYYNLKRIKTENLPPYDMLIAGFPCQTFSVIGSFLVPAEVFVGSITNVISDNR